MASGKDGDVKGKNSREERLAATLRENLKRRKAQARALAGQSSESDDGSVGSRSPTLPKGRSPV